MKKFITILLSIMFILVFVSCSKVSDANKDEEIIEVTSDKATDIVEESVDTVTDSEGNTYKTMKIGNQTWMVENLRSTKYPNGQEVSYHKIDDKVNEYIEAYGLLYNYSAVFSKDKVKGLAPDGWHIPSKDEWQELAEFLGGKNVAGGKMKSSDGWDKSNSDDSGFNALPAGMYDFSEVYQWQGTSAVFISSNSSSKGVVCYYIDKNSGELKEGNFHPDDAVSVRCIKDDK